MSNDATNGVSNHANRPKLRPSPRKKAEAANRVKMGFVLSEEAAQRIVIHAGMMKITNSELVEQLAMEHLRRFVVSDRQRPSET